MSAHRVVTGVEHDPALGKFHGCCVLCATPWPCDAEEQLQEARLRSVSWGENVPQGADRATLRRSQRCPVCEGCGTVPPDFYERLGAGTSTARGTCRTCNGSGVISPPQDDNRALREKVVGLIKVMRVHARQLGDPPTRTVPAETVIRIGNEIERLADVALAAIEAQREENKYE